MSRDLTLATFNLFNLQLPGRLWRFKTYSPQEYAAKIRWTAEMLRKLSADVIAFQELWSAEALVYAFRSAGLDGDYTLHTIKDDLDQGWYDIAVAAAVRRPWVVRRKRLHKGFPPEFTLVKRGGARDPEDNEIAVSIDKFARTVLDLEIGHEQHPALPAVRVMCCHLKSKLATTLDAEERGHPEIRLHAAALGAAISTIRRTAEAAALRMIVDDILRGTNTPLAVLGDLNDGPLSNTLAILQGNPRYRLYSSSRTGWRNDRGLYAASRLQQYREMRDLAFTHEYEHVKDMLDHVLVSEQFYDHSHNRVWSFRDLRIWNDFIEDDDPATSDHGVVRARFLYDPA